MIPKFRKKRRQVKSVDALKNPVVQNSQEFSKQQEFSNSLHKRRVSNRFYNQYPNSRVLVLNQGTFDRRNNSEQKPTLALSEFKGFVRQGYHKPLSLMSSMKKFEIEPEDILSKELKPSMSK